VHEKQSDYEDHPRVLMTREVLAKFRTMEAESEQVAKQQAAPQRRQVLLNVLRFYCQNI